MQCREDTAQMKKYQLLIHTVVIASQSVTSATPSRSTDIDSETLPLMHIMNIWAPSITECRTVRGLTQVGAFISKVLQISVAPLVLFTSTVDHPL